MDVFKPDEYLDFFDQCFSESDEDIIKFILETLYEGKYLKTTDCKRKSTEKSTEKMNEGKKMFANSSSSTFELLIIYSQAIAYAPNDSVELARAYGNRSAILCNARLYEDSLKDIDRAVALDYPDNLRATLYVRKAKNLLALGPKHQSEATEAIAEARRWMEKKNDADKTLQESQLEKLSKQKSFGKPFEKPDNSYIVSDIVDANEQLIGASKAIELKYSEKYGRHFVATRDIKPGEILIKQQAYASVLPVNLYYANCWNCTKRAWASVPCKNCVNVVFCNDDCRDEAWKNFHDIECPTFTLTSMEKLNDPVIMAMRLTIRALKEAASILSLKEKVEAIDSISDPITRGFTEGKLDSSKYASILTLAQSSSSKLKRVHRIENLFACANVLLAWAYATRIFEKQIENLNDLVTNESILFIGKLFMRNVNIYRNNSYEGDYQQQKQSTVEKDNDSGCMLSCLTSYFNHSCDANAQMVYSGNVMGIRSNQRIKKSEQIFVSYGNSYIQSLTINRQESLQVKYNFWCECHACNGNWGPNSKWSSFMNQSLSSEAKCEGVKALIQLDKHLKGESNENTIKKLLSTDPRYIPVLLELLDALFKNVNYPGDEISSYKELLSHNYTYNSY